MTHPSTYIKYAGALYRVCLGSKDKQDVLVDGTKELLRFWHDYLATVSDPPLENVEHLLELAKMKCGVINDIEAIKGLDHIIKLAEAALAKRPVV